MAFVPFKYFDKTEERARARAMYNLSRQDGRHALQVDGNHCYLKINLTPGSILADITVIDIRR